MAQECITDGEIHWGSHIVYFGTAVAEEFPVVKKVHGMASSSIFKLNFIHESHSYNTDV